MAPGLPGVAEGAPDAHPAASRQEFLFRKRQILASLDRSPKGSLDAPIVDFLSWLNAQEPVVTTSSCSGRIAVFLGGSAPSNSKGGEWLLISHEPLEDITGAWEQIGSALEERCAGGAGPSVQGTLASLLLEPFLLHAECADAATAQLILEVARAAGFRESGLSLGRRRVMVQLRTLAMRLEVPLAIDGRLLVDFGYFEVLLRTANERLSENLVRVRRLWDQLRPALAAAQPERDDRQWVLSCPQGLARAVKLAVEQRGWMDKSRKMVALAPAGGAEPVDVPPRLGIPVTHAAMVALQELRPADGEVADTRSGDGAEAHGACGGERGEPGAMADEVCLRGRSEEQPAECTAPGAQEAADADGAGASPVAAAKKAPRPQTVAADLEALWRASAGSGVPLSLVEGDVLPKKQRPVQQGRATNAAGAPTGCRASPQEAICSAVAQVHALAAGRAGGVDLAVLRSEVASLGAPQWRGDVALLPRGSLCGAGWEALCSAARDVGGLWEPVREALGARLLARQKEIQVDSEIRAGAVEILAGSGDSWVTVAGPKGVRYTFDVTRCMFSEGNAAEKARVAEWEVAGETVLDLYAGIGFWTLPLLAAGARQVFSCEWNPDALEALRRGLSLLGGDSEARCQVLAGDNRRAEVRAATAGRCERVMLGLIPFSREGFPNAAAALRPGGGLLHVHWNTPGDEESATAQAIARELEEVFLAERGEAWSCEVLHVQRVKWFAPRIRHIRVDVRCRPRGDPP